EIIEHEWAKARAKNPEVIMRRPCAGRNRRKRETASQCCDRLLRDLGIDKKMSKEELIQFEGLVIEILPDARYRVQLDAGYEVLAYTVALLRWEPACLASKQSFPVDFNDRIQHERKTGRPRDCDIRLRHTHRAVHGQRKGGARQPLRYRRFATAAE